MTYQMAKKSLDYHADLHDQEIKVKRDSMGHIGHTIVDVITNKIVAGEGYTLTIQDCGKFYGVEIPAVLED